MEKLPPLGKIHPEFFNRFIYPRLGRPDSSVLVKPQHGVDFGVVSLGSSVMVMSTDPFYIAHELGIEKAAWFAVHIIASDVAVSGIPPRYLSIDLNLPPEMSEKDLVLMWDTVHRECKKLGINVVTGHTARYAGCNFPMVGGATVIGIGRKKDLIIPKVCPGDMIIVSKGPAIETTGLMSAYFPEFLGEAYGSAFVKKAQKIYYQMSTVEDAKVAASAGGVTAMHDATECGVFGGLYEMASHSNVGMDIHLDNIIVQDEVRKTCKCFGIDPYCAISEGTLLATAKRSKAKGVVKALEDNGIPSSIAGEANDKRGIIRVIEKGKARRLAHPRLDPFWVKFEEYLNKRKAFRKDGSN
ncbi:MAG TPA: AIR synthase family protein [Candidatus Omnitrophota bacterium]|nr:AIR synthase family protein [Candidatus Omnitrophota bacterium]